MRIEDLERLKELGWAARDFGMRYEMLHHNRQWYLSERGGVVPEPLAEGLAASEARLLAAVRALVESAGEER